jgi:hypothetical protein
MIRRLALTAGCLVLSTVAFSAKAGAQTVDLDIAGTAGPTCSITSPTAGVMKVSTSPANPAVMTTNPAQATGASTAKFTLSCSGAADATVGIPVGQNAASTSVGNYGATLSNISPGYAVKGGSAQTANIAAPITNKIIEVDAFINNGSTALSGSYAYKVNVNVVAK